MNEMKTFRFWCQSVLPIVYDGSLSYYEVLCKVVDYINKLIEADNGIINDVDELKKEVEEVKQALDNFDTDFADKIISEYIATMVFFGLTNSGYFVAYIPDNWDNINFETTGYDVDVPEMQEYGHLCIAY